MACGYLCLRIWPDKSVKPIDILGSIDVSLFVLHLIILRYIVALLGVCINSSSLIFISHSEKESLDMRCEATHYSMMDPSSMASMIEVNRIQAIA